MSKAPNIRSLRDVRGIRDARLHSIPKQQRSVQLDLYVLAREKERLEKELFQLQIRVRVVKKRLAQNDRRMTGLLQEIGGSQGQGGTGVKQGGSSTAAVKRMRIDY